MAEGPAVLWVSDLGSVLQGLLSLGLVQLTMLQRGGGPLVQLQQHRPGPLQEVPSPSQLHTSQRQ